MKRTATDGLNLSAALEALARATARIAALEAELRRERDQHLKNLAAMENQKWRMIALLNECEAQARAEITDLYVPLDEDIPF